MARRQGVQLRGEVSEWSNRAGAIGQGPVLNGCGPYSMPVAPHSILAKQRARLHGVSFLGQANRSQGAATGEEGMAGDVALTLLRAVGATFD